MLQVTEASSRTTPPVPKHTLSHKSATPFKPFGHLMRQVTALRQFSIAYNETSTEIQSERISYNLNPLPPFLPFLHRFLTFMSFPPVNRIPYPSLTHLNTLTLPRYHSVQFTHHTTSQYLETVTLKFDLNSLQVELR